LKSTASTANFNREVFSDAVRLFHREKERKKSIGIRRVAGLA
jgi:hypothetical protein